MIGAKQSSEFAIDERWATWYITFHGENVPNYQFVLERKLVAMPDGVALDFDIYFDGKLVYSGICDVPSDEGDTEKIIDILNDLFQLELY